MHFNKISKVTFHFHPQVLQMVKGDDEIKVLVEINAESESEKLSQEKDSPDDFYGFIYDTDDDASISDQATEAVVVQNNVQQEVSREVVFNLVVYEEVAEEVVEMANDQDEALSDQEVANDSLDDEHVEEGRPRKRIRVTLEDIVKDEKPKKG
ncbi:hypothetical protein Tco_0545687 [Tanacetum coccineum]